jgi:programmed cell death protein 5
VASDEEEGAAKRREKDVYKQLRKMQIEQEKKAVVKRLMEPAAYERLMNVRVSNYELYAQLLDMLVGMAQGNRISKPISEQELRNLLARLTYRPEPKIEFRHK